MKYLYILIGGGIGSLLRYISTQVVPAIFAIPLGTLFVNSTGALVIGFLFNTFDLLVVPAGLRLLLITGFLGGYTTFSTYSLETVQCFMNGNIKQGLMNIVLHNGIGILFVVLGMWISKLLIGNCTPPHVS